MFRDLLIKFTTDQDLDVSESSANLIILLDRLNL
jgi:hypothetical protein